MIKLSQNLTYIILQLVLLPISLLGALYSLQKEKKISNEKSTIKITESISLVIKSWKHSTQYPGLTRFLVGRFFYADAINTLISGLLAVYLVEEVGLSPSDSQNLLGLAIIISIIGGYVFGKAADIYGPR